MATEVRNRYAKNLHHAVKQNDTRAVHNLLNDSPHKMPNITLEGHSQTPLHVAVSNGYYDIATLLLNNGASTTIKNRQGETPLDTAKAYDKSKSADARSMVLTLAAARDNAFAPRATGTHPSEVGSQNGR